MQWLASRRFCQSSRLWPGNSCRVFELRVVNNLMEGSDPFQDASSCEKLLKPMQLFMPNARELSHNTLPTTTTRSGNAFLTPMSAVVDSFPTVISADDLQTLDSPTMLSSDEQDMLLSGLANLPSTLSISNNELSPQLEHSDKWDLTSVSIHPAMRLHQEFSTEPRGDILSRSMERARETGQNMKGEADRLELEWCRKTGMQTHIQMDAGLPNHLSGAESTGLSVTDESPAYQFSRARSHKDLLEFVDPSDNGDSREDVTEHGKPRHGTTPMSRNVASERRRREKLNEKMYALRAMVPNISKMDKASLVGDAISYIHDLQKQGEEMQADITNLQLTKDAILAGAVVHLKKDAKRCGAVDAGGNQVLEEYRVLELEVNQVEEQIYHLRINCQKKPAVLVQLARALEALEFEIIDANLITVNDDTINTIVVKVKNGEVFKTATEVRQRTLGIIRKFGLQLRNTLY